METLGGRVAPAIAGGGFAGRRVRAFALAAAVASAAAASTALAQPPTPELTKPVNDFAGVIDPEHEAEIERRILALKQATAAKEGRDGSWSSPYGDVVAIATIETFAPYADIREYAVRLFENRGRGIGEKGKDNGLLVLVAIKDRRAQVEVGYDLEPFVPDGFAGDVSRGMTPFFARGQYGAGLLDGVTRIIGRVAQGRGVAVTGVPVAVPDATPSVRFGPWLVLAIIILIILMNSSGGGRRSRMRRGRTHWGGGSWSGWNSGVGPFGGGGGRIGGGGFGGGFGGFGGGRSGGGGGGASW